MLLSRILTWNVPLYQRVFRHGSNRQAKKSGEGGARTRNGLTRAGLSVWCLHQFVHPAKCKRPKDAIIFGPFLFLEKIDSVTVSFQFFASYLAKAFPKISFGGRDILTKADRLDGSGRPLP